MWNWKNMMKKFSTSKNKWFYVFALISHIFNFLNFRKIKNSLSLSYRWSSRKLSFFVDFKFFYSAIFKSFFSSFTFIIFLLVLLLSVLFFFFSSFSFRRSLESRFSSSFRDLFDLRKIKIFFFFFFFLFLFFFFFFFFFFRCLEILNQSTTLITCSKTQIFAIMLKTKVCEISKVIWFRLNLIRIFAVERA